MRSFFSRGDLPWFELLSETATIDSLASKKYNCLSGFGSFLLLRRRASCLFTRRWQAIKVVIALSRNMSQICDKCYMIGYRDTEQIAGYARDDAAGGEEKP